MIQASLGRGQMLQTLYHHRLPLCSSAAFPSPFPFSHSLTFRFTNPIRCSICYGHKTLPQAAIAAADPLPEDGPIELFPSPTPLFATSDEPTPLQTATSVLLTGAITVFLFRSLRRRAKLAKDTKLRSSDEKKSLAEEAMASLKSVSLSPMSAKSPPSPVQAFLGALTAGVITLILYKFTTTIESALNRQTISDNYSVRQITITIRTIINGLCYLATFVFGVNAVGLFLYSGQLFFKSFMEDPGSESEPPSPSSNSKLDDMDSSTITNTAAEEQSSEDAQ